MVELGPVPMPTHPPTPTISGNYDFTRSQIDDMLNEYRLTIARVRYLQDKLLEAGAIKKKLLKDKT